jgi:hypothetical protein
MADVSVATREAAWCHRVKVRLFSERRNVFSMQDYDESNADLSQPGHGDYAAEAQKGDIIIIIRNGVVIKFEQR